LRCDIDSRQLITLLFIFFAFSLSLFYEVVFAKLLQIAVPLSPRHCFASFYATGFFHTGYCHLGRQDYRSAATLAAASTLQPLSPIQAAGLISLAITYF